MKLTSDGKKLVVDALTEKKLTLENLAEIAFLSIATVKKFSSKRDIGSQSFIELCEKLDVDWRIVSGCEKPQIASSQETTSKLQNSQNPFTQRGMLSNVEELYGRDRELRQVFEFLHSGASVALVGCTGMGTSSLLWAIAQKAPEKLPTRKPIFLNMREILDLEDYYATLATEMGIEAETRSQFKRELREQRVLLLLDEVEQLQENWFNDGVRMELRAWANMGDRSPLRLVVAAHRPLVELFEDSGMASPFANICHELPLQPWDEETMRGFIDLRLAGTGVQFTKEEIEKIIAKSGGIPLQVMLLCYDCYESYRN